MTGLFNDPSAYAAYASFALAATTVTETLTQDVPPDPAEVSR